ncbi:MAG: hypothetical protein YYHSYBAR_001091 [Candidatus Fervidibacter sacchari]
MTVAQNPKNWRQNAFFWWGLRYLQTALTLLSFLAPIEDGTFKRCLNEKVALLTTLLQAAIIKMPLYERHLDNGTVLGVG